MSNSTPDQIAAAFDAGTLSVDTPGLDAVSGAWGAVTAFIGEFVGQIIFDVQNAGYVTNSIIGGF